MWMLAKTIDLLFTVVYYLIFARIILSWVVRNPGNRYYAILIQLTEPILGPVRNLLSKTGIGRSGIDLSPMVAILLLIFIRNILLGILI